MSGNKIYQFTVKAGKDYSSLIFRDSYLLMTVKLKDLKRTFNLNTENKLYFPYLWVYIFILKQKTIFRFNKKENYDVKLDKLPPMEDYIPDGMSVDDRKEFIKWYIQNKNTPFSLREKLLEYGSNDTQILLEALIEMRRILLKITDGFDILERSSTIAGISMNIYRSMFMQNNSIAIVPEGFFNKKYLINYFQVDMRKTIGQV